MEIIDRTVYKYEPGTKESVLQTMAALGIIKQYFVIGEEVREFRREFTGFNKHFPKFDLVKYKAGMEMFKSPDTSKRFRPFFWLRSTPIYAENTNDFNKIFDRELKIYSEKFDISEIEFKRLELDAIEENIKLFKSCYDTTEFIKSELPGFFGKYKTYLEKHEGYPLEQSPNTKIDSSDNDSQNDLPDRSVVLGLFLSYIDLQESNPFLPVKSYEDKRKHISNVLVKSDGLFKGASPKRVWDEYKKFSEHKGSKTEMTRRKKQQLMAVLKLLIENQITGEPLEACKKDLESVSTKHELKYS